MSFIPKSKYTYISFHKPFGVLSQFTSEGGHPSLEGFGLPKGVYAAGRLDRDSEGLLILSDDGPFINKLLDPKFAHPRTYLVQVEGDPSDQDLNALRKGPVIKGYKTKECLVERPEPQPLIGERNPPIRERKNIPTTWLKLTLTEGKNRQVRRMTAAVGLPTLRLIRIAIGDLSLENLEPGQWREILKGDILSS
ncbi:pseudouridine synthase [Sneathiella sp.]|uniref:pseudouridine synthase n=1 Tax=Sneathiella sp. TaxID=1964365 RepID=UPI0039E56D5E